MFSTVANATLQNWKSRNELFLNFCDQSGGCSMTLFACSDFVDLCSWIAHVEVG